MTETLNCTNIWLKKGSKGSQVTLLQTHLKTLGYYVKYNGYTLKIDGDFAKYTVWAVKNFQKAEGLLQDGIVGPVTCARINKKIEAKNATTSSSSTSTNTTSKVQTKKHEIQQVCRTENANIIIGGVNLIASTVTPTSHFKNNNWKSIELTTNEPYHYKGHEVLREYSVEVYLRHEQFVQLEYDLYLISDKICDVVSQTMIPSGKYTVSISVAEERVMEKKLTIKLVEAK